MKTLALLLSLLIALPAIPQQLPTLGETMEVSIVNVDVFVTDKQGNRVRGLARDDFEIYENGVRQNVTNFAEYTAADTVGVSANVPAMQRATEAPRQKRTMVVFIEQMRLNGFHATAFIDEIKSLVRKTIRPGDSLAMVLWGLHNSVQVDAGDNVAMFERALDRFAGTAFAPRLDESTQIHRELAEVRQFESEVAEFGAQRGFPGSRVTVASQADFSLRSDDPMLRAFLEMKRRVAAINATINALSAGEGKKVLLLATRRLGEVAGAEFTATGQPNFLQKQKFGTEVMIGKMIDNANAAGVTIYPIYPIGLVSSLTDASLSSMPNNAFEHLVLMNETLSQARIARETGGLTAWGADIIKLLPRIAGDVSDYYSLAYRANSDGSRDRARDLTVKTKNPEYTVRARRQFVEKSDDTDMRDRLIAMLFRNVSENPIAIVAEHGPIARKGRRETMQVRVRIPIGALTLVPQANGKHVGAFSVWLISAARLEELSDLTRKTQTFEIEEKDLERAKQGHFTYDLEVVVNTIAERVAVGVRDEVAKTYGLARIELDAKVKVSS